MKLHWSVLLIILLHTINLLPQNSWQLTKGPYGDKIRTVVSKSNGMVFAGTTRGGIYRTLNYGDDWVEINNGIPTRSISDPYTSERRYICS